MIRQIVFLLLACSLNKASNIISQENVIFERTNEIATTRSKWLVSFAINITPYQDLLDTLDKSLNKIMDLVLINERISAPAKLSGNPLLRIKELLQVIKVEVQNMKSSQKYLFKELKGIQSMHRSKRSLIPIIGKALSALFGTVSEDELNDIRSNIKKLYKNQLKVVHSVDKTSTTLRVTQGQVIENRQTLNDVIQNIKDLHEKSGVEMDLITGIHENVELYTLLDRSLSKVTALLNIARDHSQYLKLQLNMLSLGHLSPSVIAPLQLKQLLLDIQSKLPPHYKFPFDPQKDMWKIYKTLTCTSIVHDDSLIVVTVIPLLDNIGTFDIYKIHNLPVPRKEHNQTGILAKYDLETNNIAINKKRTQFALLSNQETKQCSSPLKAYCTFKSPLYSVMNTKTCAIHLFKGNKEEIVKFCKIVIVQGFNLPKAQYLTQGHWLIISTDDLSFTVSCNASQNAYEIKIQTPLDIIFLGPSCTATNGYMTLLPYYKQRSNSQIKDTFQAFLNQYQSEVPTIWKTCHKIIPSEKKIKIPSKLKRIKVIPLNTLSYELDDLENIESEGPDYWICLLGTTLFLLILIFRKYLFKILKKVKSKTGLRSVMQNKFTQDQEVPEPIRPSAPVEMVKPVKSMGMVESALNNQRLKPDPELQKQYLREKYGLVPLSLVQELLEPYGMEITPENDEHVYQNTLGTTSPETVEHNLVSASSADCDVNTETDEPQRASPQKKQVKYNPIYPSGLLQQFA